MKAISATRAVLTAKRNLHQLKWGLLPSKELTGLTLYCHKDNAFKMYKKRG